MKLVYIAGPYTSKDPWEAEQNVRRAEALGLEVMKLGAWPVIPHSNTRHYFVAACTYEQALAATMEMMRRCDAVIFVEGWQRSGGARAEFEEAVRIGKPHFAAVHALDRLRAWLEAHS